MLSFVLWIWKKGAQESRIMQMEQIPFLPHRLCCFPLHGSWLLSFVCFSECWQFFQWSKLGHIRKWKQLSVAILRRACLLYCKDEGPWILDTLPPPPVLSNTSQHSDAQVVCLDSFYFWLTASGMNDLKIHSMPCLELEHPFFINLLI